MQGRGDLQAELLRAFVLGICHLCWQVAMGRPWEHSDSCAATAACCRRCWVTGMSVSKLASSSTSSLGPGSSACGWNVGTSRIDIKTGQAAESRLQIVKHGQGAMGAMQLWYIHEIADPTYV